MCCFNKVNLSAILLVHKHIINKDCTVKNNNEVKRLEDATRKTCGSSPLPRRCLGRVPSFLKYSSWCRRGIINSVLPYFLWYIQTGGWFHTEVARDEKQIYLFLTSKRHVSKTKHFHVLWNLVTCVSYCRTWHKVMTVSTSQTSWHWKVND